MKYSLLLAIILIIECGCLEYVEATHAILKNNIKGESLLKKLLSKNSVLEAGNRQERSVFGKEKVNKSKIQCQSQNGRIVCRLDDYTFVINNEGQLIDSDVVEKFAAMLYHKAQRGYSEFQIGINSLNKDVFYLAPSNGIEREAVVVVECNPLSADKKNRESITYECNWKEYKSPKIVSNEGLNARLSEKLDFPNGAISQRILSFLNGRRRMDRLQDLPSVPYYNNIVGNRFSSNNLTFERLKEEINNFFKFKRNSQTMESRELENTANSSALINNQLQNKDESYRKWRKKKKFFDKPVWKRQCCPSPCPTKPTCCPVPQFRATFPCCNTTPCCPPRTPPPDACCPLAPVSVDDKSIH